MGSVYLYGSLAWGKHFSARSDIDLLVEGFPVAAGYWRALVEAEKLANIVELEQELQQKGPAARQRSKAPRPALDPGETLTLRTIASVPHDFYVAAENISSKP